MIPLKELSRVRIRSIRRLVRRNQKEVGVVIRIDREKGRSSISVAALEKSLLSI